MVERFHADPAVAVPYESDEYPWSPLTEDPDRCVACSGTGRCVVFIPTRPLDPTDTSFRSVEIDCSLCRHSR